MSSADYPASPSSDRDLRGRTKAFALRAIRLVEALPRNYTEHCIGGQLVRSATSVGANYRAACRARSHREFIAKLGIAEEEADESVYWLELVIESNLLPGPRVEPILQEANELTAILVASRKTAKRRA